MGRATRWLKSLFGIRRDKEQKQNSDSGGPKNMKWPSSESTNARVLCHNPTTIPPNISQAEAAWLQSFYAEKEQNNRVIADAAVFRLTSHQRGNMLGVGHETCAAVKIQTIFRGYLARKAHRALKGLVKLQALVRGYLVRKQATATFHSMQALVRAQATIMSHKSQRLKCRNNEARGFQNQVRRSKERFYDTRNEYETPIHHSRRLSSSLDATINNNNSVDGSPKIVEVDISRPISRSRRTNTTISDFGDDPLFQALCSPFSYRTPARLSTPNHRNLHESEWGLTGGECRFSSSAQSTPRFANSCGCGTPKSVCNDNFFVGKYYPNYMASTQSFKAKLRSHSAPKQRPEPSSRKRLSLNEMMECRKSLSGVRMQRSCSQVQQVVNFKNAVMDRLQKSTEYVGETHRNYF